MSSRAANAVPARGAADALGRGAVEHARRAPLSTGCQGSCLARPAPVFIRGGGSAVPAAWGTGLHGVYGYVRCIHELPAGGGVGEGPPPAGAAGYLPSGKSCPQGEPTVVCPMVGASHGCDGCAPQRLHHCVGRDGKPRRFQPCHGAQASRPQAADASCAALRRSAHRCPEIGGGGRAVGGQGCARWPSQQGGVLGSTTPLARPPAPGGVLRTGGRTPAIEDGAGAAATCKARAAQWV